MADGTTAAKRRRARGPTTPDPIEIAMEAEASGGAPAGVAHEVLRKQSLLLGWQAARERAAFALTLAGALVGLAVAMLLGAMVWRAAHADGVVVRPFTTPADLAADGLSGEALAARVLDRIDALRLRTGATLMQRATGFQGADDGGLRLEIPQTGVSIGELDAYLRRWLGHERIITGALTRAGDTLTLTVRYAGEPAVTATGSASDLDRLVTEAADEVFGLADPIRAVLAQPMTTAGHDRTVALLTRVRAGRNRSERQFGYSFSANQTPDAGQALAYIAEAGRLNRATGALNHRELMVILTGLGKWEGALAHATAGPKSIPRDDSGWTPGAKAWVTDQMRASGGAFTGDFRGAEQATLRVNDPALGVYRGRRDVAPFIAAQHDAVRASTELSRVARLGLPVSADSRARVALYAGDWPAAAAAYAVARTELDAVDAEARAAGWPQSLAGRTRRIPLTAEQALAMAEAGDLAGAATLIAPTPADCYPCILTRARIAWLGGDLAGAERAYAEAVRQGPSLPMAYEAWGQLALARGDPNRAADLARSAAARGPRWADPKKLEGDALLALRRPADAARAYAAAAKLAPNWGRLHLKWGEALAKLGKADEARAKWRAAATMDLSAADRAALKAHGV